MVVDFLKNLGRQKLNNVQAKAKGKVMGAQARAKSKAAAGIDKKLKQAGNKAKAKAAGAVQNKGDKPKPKKAPAQKKQAAKKKDDKMGLFGKKGRAESNPQMAAAEEPQAFGDKTQIFQAIQDEGPKACVGWLVAMNGPLKGIDFRLVDGKNIIGTAADCDIVLTDQYMSSRHAVIRHEDGEFVMVDLDSTNGTYLNDQRLQKEEMIDNDKVRLGRTEMKFKSLN